MEALTLPKGYPGNRYSHRITIPGIVDPGSVKVVLRHGKGRGVTSEQFEWITERTSGARSHDVTISRQQGFPRFGTFYLEVFADGQVVRSGTLIISYDHN